MGDPCCQYGKGAIDVNHSKCDWRVVGESAPSYEFRAIEKLHHVSFGVWVIRDVR
jgi:hypothetical protein